MSPHRGPSTPSVGCECRLVSNSVPVRAAMCRHLEGFRVHTSRVVPCVDVSRAPLVSPAVAGGSQPALTVATGRHLVPPGAACP
eukprot:907234-Prorocentrum_minimum.AAC.1